MYACYSATAVPQSPQVLSERVTTFVFLAVKYSNLVQPDGQSVTLKKVENVEEFEEVAWYRTKSARSGNGRGCIQQDREFA